MPEQIRFTLQTGSRPTRKGTVAAAARRLSQILSGGAAYARPLSELLEELATD